MGFKRSEARMKEIEKKLRRGMEKNGIAIEAQEEILKSICSFALYGFPESHAASFALLAYASAFLKCHYLAAFTAAMLNNQPMGFYNPATLVKDAQRHGLKIKPMDVTCSDWLCTLETAPRKLAETAEPGFAVRLGLRYVKGLRAEIAADMVRERALRPFAGIEDLKLRVPAIQKSELATLAEIGALNFIARERGSAARPIHRRDALWQIERAARRAGPLLEAAETVSETSSETPIGINEPENTTGSPLAPMTAEERLVADFRGTGITTGPHPMAYHRAELKRQGIRAAGELPGLPDGTWVRVAGAVIARQRPGTAKGFVFLSLEDETGIANAIITPQLFAKDHGAVVGPSFLLVEGPLQNQDNVISVKAERVRPLSLTRVETASHDFH